MTYNHGITELDNNINTQLYSANKTANSSKQTKPPAEWHNLCFVLLLLRNSHYCDSRAVIIMRYNSDVFFKIQPKCSVTLTTHCLWVKVNII